MSLGCLVGDLRLECPVGSPILTTILNRLRGLVVTAYVPRAKDPGSNTERFKGTTSQVAGRPSVLDRTVTVLDQTVIVLDRTVTILDRTVIVLDQTVIVLDQTVIVLDQTVIVLDRTVIVLDRTVKTIYGVLSFPPAWRWVRPRVRPSLVTWHYEPHQHTGPPNSLLS